MRILITGATGYLGAIITKHLFNQGHETIAWCRSLNDDKKEVLSSFSTRIIIGDILDEKAISSAKKSCPDIIIHLVSLNHKDSELDIKKSLETNVYGTWRLLEEFKSNNLSRFVYFSTIQVLGNLESGTIDESFPANPQNVYGLTHNMSETILNSYKLKTSFIPVTIRLTNGYGSPVFSDNNCWTLVVNDLCRMAFIQKKIVLQSDGSPQRDFIHVSDIVKATSILISTSFSTNDNQIVNLASSKTFTILELATIIKSIFQKRFGIEIPIITKYGNVENNYKDMPAIKKYRISNNFLNQIGYSPTVTIEQGIEELINYLERSV